MCQCDADHSDRASCSHTFLITIMASVQISISSDEVPVSRPRSRCVVKFFFTSRRQEVQQSLRRQLMGIEVRTITEKDTAETVSVYLTDFPIMPCPSLFNQYSVVRCNIRAIFTSRVALHSRWSGPKRYFISLLLSFYSGDALNLASVMGPRVITGAGNI